MWINWQWAGHNLVSCNSRKRQYKIRTISDRSPSIKFTIMKSGVFKCDRKTKTSASSRSRTRWISAPESVKDSGKRGRLHSLPMISDADRNTIYLGADDSRQANSLSYEGDYLRLNAEYLFGKHSISFGYHREELSVFNLFVQHSNGGEWDYFDDSAGNDPACDALTAQQRNEDPNCGTTGLDKFELGLPSRVYYGSGGGTNNANDAGASFTNTLNAVFAQDEFTLDNIDLTITAGLRMSGGMRLAHLA